MSAFATIQQHNALSHRVDQNGRRISSLEETFAFVKEHMLTKQDLDERLNERLRAYPTRDETRAFVAKTKYDILDHMDRRFNEADQRFAGIDKRFSQMDKRFSNMDVKIDVLDQKVDILDEKFDSLNQKVDLVINKLDKQ